jgi:heat-inducible transcriptional repressor
MPGQLDISQLEYRQHRVLRAVIEQYIETAQPVSSGQVYRTCDLGVSPATIRNEMVRLTELGLLSQPHTSAGRVPTEAAFRRYVDELLTRDDSFEVAPGLVSALAESSGEVGALLRSAADLLSASTGQLGFFLAAGPDHVIVRHARLVRLSAERVMALVVSERGVVQSRILEESETPPRELERIGERLSEFIAGSTLSEARARLARALEEDRTRGDRLWRKVLALGTISFQGLSEVSLYVGDRAHLLDLPEFAHVERLRELLSAIEEKERMVQLLDRVLEAQVREVRIGAEIGDPEMRACALVTAPFGDSPALGGLGVLGPVRMPYGRVIPLVRSLSLHVNRYLS